MDKEQQIKCPKCNSTDVKEEEVSVFESTMKKPAVKVGAAGALLSLGVLAGPMIIPLAGGLLASAALGKTAKNNYDKRELDLEEKKRYRCLNCGKLFEK